MRRICALVLAALLLVAPAGAVFWDVTDAAWYAPAVSYVEDHGLMNGVPGGAFDPNGIVSRGMLATILHREAGAPHSVAGLYFDDLEAGSWYIDSVIWCAEMGVITGSDATHFFPDHPITREQMALMLWRLAGWPTPQGNSAYFTDGAQINLWAKGGVDWAVGAGVISGKPDGSFAPQSWTTRAEAAQMLMKYDLWKMAQG